MPSESQTEPELLKIYARIFPEDFQFLIDNGIVRSEFVRSVVHERVSALRAYTKNKLFQDNPDGAHRAAQSGDFFPTAPIRADIQSDAGSQVRQPLDTVPCMDMEPYTYLI